MRIIEYKYIHGTKERKNYIAIPELDRYKSSVKQFIELANLKIELTNLTALLYVEGFATSQAESGINKPPEKNYIPAIKSGTAYIAHEWAYTFKNNHFLEVVDIMSGTCASGIKALHEANYLLKNNIVEEVIIIGGERITKDTIRLFKELMIPVTCGDGFFYMRLGHSNFEGEDPHIDDIKWKYAFNRNPFVFKKETLDTLIPEYKVDFVKLHGTGTPTNTAAESGIAKIAKNRVYKNIIGHTQGVSSLLETCILLDDSSIRGKILVVANGLGGFYGSFTLIK